MPYYQWRSEEFCSEGASHWRRQRSIFSYFVQRSYWYVRAQFPVDCIRIWRQISSTSQHQ